MERPGGENIFGVPKNKKEISVIGAGRMVVDEVREIMEDPDNSWV